MEEEQYPLVEEELCKFHSISDIPLFLCTLSVNSTEFLVYNVENNKICARIQNPVPYKLQIRGASCLINGSQLFWLGGASQNGDIVGACLLIDIKEQSIEILSSGKPRLLITPVFLENFVYDLGALKAIMKNKQVVISLI
ncbi:unnamed protein product [Blepharisma stoltei]|uniref:Recombination activating protein 2 n=1 Tax=Blepharisma stoltei TaxID=1481888 RepID=A0AAU9J7J7_9CILI|nr:unnamed protein product [Blepharisma stoltei]